MRNLSKVINRDMKYADILIPYCYMYKVHWSILNVK